MELIYEKEYQLTDMQTDAFGRAKPSALLSFAQDIAGEHAAQLSDNWEQLQQKHLFWAVTRHYLEVFTLPKVGETVRLKTWPMVTTRVAYPRAVEGYGQDGTLLFRMVSLWVLMDTQKRSLVLPGRGGLQIDGCNRGCEAPLPVSLAPAACENTASRTVQYSELDRNGHMNNTRYLDWVDDLLPLAFHKSHTIGCCTVCYLQELLPGQSCRLHWQMDGDGLLHLDGVLSDSAGDKRIFAAQVQFRDCVL
ncbi:MAG: hypothetical protein IJD63_02030 [Oscillospiraceae bacterium]|nr:hypothetical protein [Oscillospiraceae bacterium]